MVNLNNGASESITTASLDATTLTARLVREGLIGLVPAAKLFGTGRNGRGKHPSTLTRYHHKGVKRPDGRVVKLECVRVSSQLRTSEAAVLRFLTALQDPAGGNDGSLPPTRRQRAKVTASAELDAALGTPT